MSELRVTYPSELATTLLSPRRGSDYDTMVAEDVVVYDMDGNHVEGKLKPSSELPLHIAVYKSTDAQAVTHNHAYASTALGLVVDEIPPSHYYSGMLGGIIRVAPYAEFGTDQLAINVAKALESRSGALMKNHGAITLGPNLKKAVNLLPILEYISRDPAQGHGNRSPDFPPQSGTDRQCRRWYVDLRQAAGKGRGLSLSARVQRARGGGVESFSAPRGTYWSGPV